MKTNKNIDVKKAIKALSNDKSKIEGIFEN